LTEVNLNNKKLYECDITRAQFEKILPILESAKNKTRPRTTDLYLVFCGILYLLKTGCQWRLIPKEYPDWKLLHYYFTIWNKTEVLNKVLKKISWRGPTKQWSQAHKN
jgi:transposase